MDEKTADRKRADVDGHVACGDGDMGGCGSAIATRIVAFGMGDGDGTLRPVVGYWSVLGFGGGWGALFFHPSVPNLMMFRCSR